MKLTFPKKKRLKDTEALREARTRPCIICRKPSDPCHIRSRGAGGADEEANLLSCCREHHQEQHQIGFVRFAERYPAVRRHLEARGWEIVDVFGLKRLVRK